MKCAKCWAIAEIAASDIALVQSCLFTVWAGQWDVWRAAGRRRPIGRVACVGQKRNISLVCYCSDGHAHRCASWISTARTHTHTHVRAHCYWLRPLKAWRSYQTDSVGEVFQTINIAHTHSVSTGAGAMAISKNEFSSAISAPMAWNFAHA